MKMKRLLGVLVLLLSCALVGCTTKETLKDGKDEIKEITIGEETTLAATDADAVWKSANEAVASATEGRVKGLSSGIAIITATGSTTRDRFTVSVKSASEVEIRISGDRTALVGDDVTLSASGSSTITWTSSNPSVASVDEDGLVKALAVGTTMITASAGSASDVIYFTVKTAHTPEALQTKLGIDCIDDYASLFTGKKVGLITNQSGVNSAYTSSIDVLASKVNLTALFAPEHGIRGNSAEGASVSTVTDEVTVLPIYSLYGSTQKPTEAMLANVDVLCFDIQDCGARFYTFIYTMAYAMQACAQYGKTFVVFDRPNPISGSIVEGNILDMAYSSFIGLYPLVQRHGMTVGELATMFNTEYDINCDLKVIKMENYDRSAYLDEINGMPWVNPSPNMPTVDCATVYPGTCVFEGTNLSVGRGTTKPFQWVGAPYINAITWAKEMNALGLPGCVFRPVWFTPTSSTNSGSLCAGVEVHVTNRETFEAVLTGWAMLSVVRKLYPDDVTLNKSTIQVNTGCAYIYANTYTIDQLATIIASDTAKFRLTRAKYLLY